MTRAMIPVLRQPGAALAAFVLAVCFLFNLVGRGFADTYVVFLLPVGSEFGWNRSRMSGIYSVYLLSAGLSGPLIGMLYQRYGPRVVYGCGIVLLGVAYLLAGRLNSFWQFVVCVGFLSGVAVSALGMVPAVTLINQWFRSHTSSAISVAYAGYGCGTLIMVPLAQYLNEQAGWRNAYQVLGASALLLLPLIWVLPWAAMRAGPVGAKDGALCPCEVGRERWTLRKAVCTSEFWSLAQIFFFSSVAMYMIIVQAVAYLIDIGFPPLQAAGAFGMLGLLSVACVALAGYLSDRVGFRFTATASFVVTLLGLAVLLVLSYRPTSWLLAGFIALFGLSQGARGPIVSALAGKLFPGRGLSSIYGGLYACMSLGAASGALLAGVLHDLTGGYRTSFVLSMAALVIAALPFWTSTAIDRIRLQGEHARH